MPKLYIISGCNGSGKTTASYTILPEMLNCHEYVNSDEFAKSLSPFDPSAASVTASRYMLMKIKFMFEHQMDFCIETTLATRTLIKMVEEARAKGYFVTVIYLWLNSPELAIQRVRARVTTGGHNIPEDTIRRRYQRGLEYFFHEYRHICDRWILADNSRPPFKVVAEGSHSDTMIKNTDKFALIWSMAYPEDSDY
jgi:predicted ABC-type ATPase